MIKAVIFDMDGVLVDAKEWHYEALNNALRLFGFEISRYQHLTAYDGLPTMVKLNMLSKEFSLPSKLHPFINEMKQKYTMNMALQHCKPNFIHEFALSKLKSEGYLLGLASNSIRSTVDVFMRLTHLEKYLDAIVSSSDVTKPKPDPEMYISCIHKLGLKPTECLVLEDNENGIKAAMASGAHVLTVSQVTDVNFENIIKKIRLLNGVHDD